jgi:hypothetical protein
MNTFKIPLIVLLAAASAATCPPPGHLAAATDSDVLAERVRQLEERLARLERLHGEDVIVPGMRAVAGVWRIDGKEIVSPDDPVALLQLPKHAPEEYILSLRVRRISGNNTFAIGVRIGGRQVLVALDAHLSSISGLEYLDGKFVHENEAAFRGSLFVPDKIAAISVTVRNNRITCAFDDVTVIDWRGDVQRLSLPDTFAVPDRKALFLATLGSKYAVSEIRLSPLDSPVVPVNDSSDRDEHKRSGSRSEPRRSNPASNFAAQVSSAIPASGFAGSTKSSDGRLASFRDRWKLQLLPEKLFEKLPDLALHLVGTTWAHRSPRDILGRGVDRFITFPEISTSPARREIVFTTIQHRGVNAGNSMTEATEKHPVVIAGPFLEYDGLIHTGCLSADGKVFVADAALRIAEGGKWYFVSSRKLPEENEASGGIEVAEYLLEFDDDPVKHRQGYLTLTRIIRKAIDPAGEVKRIKTNFAQFEHRGDDSQPYQVQIGTPESRSLTVFFYAGRDYAVQDGNGPPEARMYRLEEID